SRSEELARRLSNGGKVPAELFGEILMDVVNLARLNGVRAEDCLHGQISRMETSF
ncbi:MAG: hypothetical protein GX422_17615, partial [Deltaproteobacteria bacterium]|nr:hypothetical protein [Deltaproteobacteria bacterium]